MRLALLLLAILMPIACASAEDGYYSMHGNSWSAPGYHEAPLYSTSYYYPAYSFWPYPSVPAKCEVQAAKERLQFNKYLNPYSAWWQVQAAKERLSAVKYACDYCDVYEVPVFRGKFPEEKSYEERHRRMSDGGRKKLWTDDSPEDVHVPLADEIRMELEREGVISGSK